MHSPPTPELKLLDSVDEMVLPHSHSLFTIVHCRHMQNCIVCFGEKSSCTLVVLILMGGFEVHSEVFLLPFRLLDRRRVGPHVVAEDHLQSWPEGEHHLQLHHFPHCLEVDLLFPGVGVRELCLLGAVQVLGVGQVVYTTELVGGAAVWLCRCSCKAHPRGICTMVKLLLRAVVVHVQLVEVLRGDVVQQVRLDDAGVSQYVAVREKC